MFVPLTNRSRSPVNSYSPGPFVAMARRVDDWDMNEGPIMRKYPRKLHGTAPPRLTLPLPSGDCRLRKVSRNVNLRPAGQRHFLTPLTPHKATHHDIP